MTKSLKKPEFLHSFARFFTRAEGNAYDPILFRARVWEGDEEHRALGAPGEWSDEAVAVMAQAACAEIPAALRAVEENTVPSWLWQHRASGKGRAAEGDARDIIDRAVGSAVAKAWRLGLLSGEKQARAFYDEARYALAQRHIAIAPDVLAGWGLDWAYGLEAAAVKVAAHQTVTALSNGCIDAVTGVAKNAPPAPLWKKLFAVKSKQPVRMALRFSDVAGDWHASPATPAQAAIDVMALRHNDGSVNIAALRQAARMLGLLLDLQERNDVTVGLVNLAPLVLALGLAYDSDAGRALVASITALVTAEAYAASAEMAALRGESAAFADQREAVMRSLRNHRRAVYGDSNDYEKLSVAPAALSLKNCPDLALAAEAQRRWDDVLEMTRAFGLRATQVTDLTPSPAMGVLTGAASQGLEPMARLTVLAADEDGGFYSKLHASVAEAMGRLHYPRPSVKAVATHIAGTHTLHKAPAINHASLRAAGLSEAVIEKIEAWLPCVDNIRLAVTPWIVGVDFCRTQLKIAARVIESPRSDLLKHLGFSDADVVAANLYAYGHGTARNAKILNLRHRPLFACGAEVSVEARLRMAVAVQAFVSGDTGIVATLPAAQSVARGAEVTLAAWREGLRSLALVFDPALAAAVPKTGVAARRIKPAAHVQAAVPAPARRVAKGKSVAVPTAQREHEKRVRG